MVNQESRTYFAEGDNRKTLTFEEAKSLILKIMRAKPGDCEMFCRLLTITESNLLRCSGATMDGVMDTLFELQEIHNPHCPILTGGAGVEDKRGANTHTNK